ncbi:MAG: hypothetical protein LBU09_04675 [Endomicrobium sp.]|jgi:hypothetical protein|nr:hypothetical protein [Endomicrobium sp.]
MEFHEQIVKLYQRKTGTDISVKAAIEKGGAPPKQEEAFIAQESDFARESGVLRG